MEIILAENLKSLRKSKGNTQEQLAEFLGITVQAISKWERAEGYPDITLLPRLAAFYQVTIDELLGVGEVRKRERVDKILVDVGRYRENGEIAKSIILLREAIIEFPSNYHLLEALMSDLLFSDKKEYLDEVVAIGQSILSGCTDDQIRYSALQILCLALPQLGRRDEARQFAKRLPFYSVTSNDVLCSILEGKELLVHAQNNIAMLVDDIWINAQYALRAGNYLSHEKIHIYETIIKFFELLYDDGDLGFYHCRLADCFKAIAALQAESGLLEAAISSLEQAFRHAAKYDNLADHRLTALLVNNIEYRKSSTSKNYTESYTQLLTKAISDKVFDSVRGDPRFKASVKCG